MKLSLYIAKRYLFSKKTHQVINYISAIAVAGIALATAAMICTSSVFNGFKDLVAQQFTAFDPELKITATHGKFFSLDDTTLNSIESLPEIALLSGTMEDMVMVQYGGRQTMAHLKGVPDNFNELTEIEKALLGNGRFLLHDQTVDYAIMGIDLLSALNCGVYFVEPLEIYAPKRGVRVNLTNPSTNFQKGLLYSPGKVFMVNQTTYDSNYILTSLDFVRELFQRENDSFSSIELKLASGANVKAVEKELHALLGEGYLIQDRFEQQDSIFRIMKIEKFISYLFLSFILAIACFNVIGSLSMLILEKKEDAATLRSMGADEGLITGIFVTEGSLISAIGALLGILLGVALCLLQQHYSLLSFGDAASSFVVEGYPVKVEVGDVAMVFITVLSVGLLSMGLPVRYLTRRLLAKK